MCFAAKGRNKRCMYKLLK